MSLHRARIHHTHTCSDRHHSVGHDDCHHVGKRVRRAAGSLPLATGATAIDIRSPVGRHHVGPCAHVCIYTSSYIFACFVQSKVRRHCSLLSTVLIILLLKTFHHRNRPIRAATQLLLRPLPSLSSSSRFPSSSSSLRRGERERWRCRHYQHAMTPPQRPPLPAPQVMWLAEQRQQQRALSQMQTKGKLLRIATCCSSPSSATYMT